MESTATAKPAARAEPNFENLDLSPIAPNELHAAGVANGMTQKQIALRVANARGVPIDEFCAQHQRRG